MTAARTADLLITGRIATLAGESGFGWQGGLAIAGGRVLAVGERRDLEALAGPRTVRWRLAADELAMPGIIDAHMHLMNLVLAESQLDLNGRDLPATLAAIAERHRQMDAAGDRDAWLLGHGWSVHDLGRWPDSAMLDQAAPGRAVALYAHDHHSRWVSSEALRRVGVVADAGDPVGGFIRRDDSGRPTGILHETASSLIDDSITNPSRDELVTALRRVAATLAQLGVTGCHDPGELTAETTIERGPVLYRDLAQSGELPLRVHASVRAPQLDTAIELGMRSGQRTGRYTMGWLKLFADGSLGSRSAAMLEPYSDAAESPPTGGPEGMFRMTPEEMGELLRRAASTGISGQIHAIGDAAVRTALDVLAATPPTAGHDGAPARLLRRIEHAQLVHPDDQPRFGRLGVAASVQPVHLRSDARPARAGWGDRADHAFPLRGLLAGGALIPFGTDAPVEAPDPWPGIAVAICRRDPFDEHGPILGADHRISLDRSLRAACLDPALVAGQRDLGRLLPGFRADLIVVRAVDWETNRDPAAVAGTRPVATLIDGAVAYAEDRFAT